MGCLVGLFYLAFQMARLFVYLMVFFVKATVEICKALVMMVLALTNAAQRANRRRAVRKAYERRRALQAEAYRRGVSTESLTAAAHKRPNPDYTPAWQVTAPRDDPNWRPRP